MSAISGVSILVATYNGAKYLDEQMRSNLQQVSQDDEVIVLDDCSTDDTPTLLGHYREGYPALTVLRNERNLGVRRTFERLLELSTKDVVFLSDQDDVWIEGRKDAMASALAEENGPVAVLANALVLTGDQVGRPFFPDGYEPKLDSVVTNLAKNHFIGCCMAVRRPVLELALPFPASISMHDWWLGSCAIAAGKVRYLAAPSLLYRRHGGNQSAAARRSWRVIAKDRAGNLLALATLWERMFRSSGT